MFWLLKINRSQKYFLRWTIQDAFHELDVRNQAKPESLQTFKAPSKEIAEMFIEYYVVRIL